jgi:hypothetical protein
MTSHDEKDFYDVFTQVVDFCAKNGMYVNMYFDPLDVIKFKNLDIFFQFIDEHCTNIGPYRDISKNFEEMNTDENQVTK